MSDDKVKIGKITVKMGDTEVSLTVEQARELCALLKGLFGDDSTKIIHTHDHWYPRPWYMGPTWEYSGYNWSVNTDSIPMEGATVMYSGSLTNAAASNVTFTSK